MIHYYKCVTGFAETCVINQDVEHIRTAYIRTVSRYLEVATSLGTVSPVEQNPCKPLMKFKGIIHNYLLSNY